MLSLHHKTRGEIAEALFIAIAKALGFRVSRPFGDNCPYDFILDWHGHLIRVQLKSAWTLGRNRRAGLNSYKEAPGAPSLRSKGGKVAERRGRYQIATGCGPKRKRRYTSRDIDFLIAYIADGSRDSVGPGVSPGHSAHSTNGGASRRSRETRNEKLETLMSGTWYILPAHVISTCLSVYFTANPTRSRFAPYRNAWHLLRGNTQTIDQ